MKDFFGGFIICIIIIIGIISIYTLGFINGYQETIIKYKCFDNTQQVDI